MIEYLVKISQAIGFDPDMIQGGGGNTSVKNNEGKMWIKASGSLLKELDHSNGFVEVDASIIKNNLFTIGDKEESYNSLLEKSVLVTQVKNKRRPSMETGFHALLGDYIIHSHSVYTNIVNCAKEGQNYLSKLEKILNKKIIWIPYTTPGYPLSILIGREIEKCSPNVPTILFLQNHGLIVSGDTHEEVILLHKTINEVLKKELAVATYPTASITTNRYHSFDSSSYILTNIKKYLNSDISLLEKEILFPDQIVFFKDKISWYDSSINSPNKVLFTQALDEIYYSTTTKEAQTIQETLIAYFYILEHIHKLGWTPNYLASTESNAISNLESEKFRKKIIK